MIGDMAGGVDLRQIVGVEFLSGMGIGFEGENIFCRFGV